MFWQREGSRVFHECPRCEARTAPKEKFSSVVDDGMSATRRAELGAYANEPGRVVTDGYASSLRAGWGQCGREIQPISDRDYWERWA